MYRINKTIKSCFNTSQHIIWLINITTRIPDNILDVLYICNKLKLIPNIMRVINTIDLSALWDASYLNNWIKIEYVEIYLHKMVVMGRINQIINWSFLCYFDTFGDQYLEYSTEKLFLWLNPTNKWSQVLTPNRYDLPLRPPTRGGSNQYVQFRYGPQNKF